MAEFAADVLDEGKGPPPATAASGGGGREEDSYPLTIFYCGVCGLPPEYCEYGSTGEACRAWAEANCPEVLAIEEGITGLEVQGDAGGEAAGGAERAAGGEEGPKKKGKKVRIAKPGGKKAAGGEQRVVIGRLSRNRRKFVTVVGGLDTFPDVKIKDAAKKIGKQFACGSSVSKAPSGAEEVVIQGDVLMDLPGFLETTLNIPAAKISVLSTS
ncbi:unnamed protein product [Ectocarpus sp. 4 AP-2014]